MSKALLSLKSPNCCRAKNFAAREVAGLGLGGWSKEKGKVDLCSLVGRPRHHLHCHMVGHLGRIVESRALLS